MTRKFKAPQVQEAIKGSGGITSTVAKRLDCHWVTANKHINKWESTRQAWKDEQETALDMCEQVILKSIQEGDTQNAKWMLSRLRKDKFAPRQEVTGADGERMSFVVRVTNDTN